MSDATMTDLPRAVLDCLREGCQVIGPGYRYLYVNAAAAAQGQATKEQLLGRTMMEAYPGIDQTEMFSVLRRCMEDRGSVVMENEFTFPDGSKGWFELRFEPVPQGVAILSVDITRRKRDEVALRRSLRAHALLSECNQNLVRATDEQEFLDHVCRFAVERAGYRMAWLGFKTEGAGQRVEPVAHAGSNLGHADLAKVVWCDTERGAGPTGAAIRTGKLEIAHCIASDERCAPWREEALERGLASCIALPVAADGEVIGALTVYAGETDAFDDPEIELLEEVALDLGYGIATLRARVARQRAQELLERTFQGSPMSTVLISMPDRVIVDVNEAFGTTFGYARSEVVGRPVTEFDLWAVPADRTTVAEILLRDGKVSGREHTFKTKSGATFVGLFYAELVRLGDERLVLTKVVDITERKRLEQDLRESRAVLAAFFDSAGAMRAVFELDGDTPIPITINQQTARYAGLDPERLPASGMDVMTRAEAQPIVDAARHCLSTGAPVTLEVHASDRRGGDWFLSSVSPLGTGENGRPRFALVMNDITAHKQGEEDLRNSEERYRTLVETSPDAVLVNRKDQIVFINAAGLRLFGASDASQVLGRPPLEFIHPDLRLLAQERIRSILEQGRPAPLVESKVVKLDGTVTEVEVAAAPFEDRGVTAIQVVMRDIAERKRMQDELAEAQRRLDSIVTSSTAMLYACEPFGDFDATFISRNLQAITGYADAEFFAKGFWASHIHPEDAPGVFASLPAVFTKKVHHHQYRFQFKDGTWHWMDSELHLLEDAAGKPKELCGTWIDITARRRAETEVRTLNAELERRIAERTAELQVKNSVFDASLAANSIADGHGVLTTVNNAFLRVWGYRDQAEVIGKPIAHFLEHERDVATIVTALDQTGAWEGDYVARRKDGSTFVAHGTATVLRDERGAVVGYQSAVLDISDRTRMTDELARARERLVQATESAQIGVWEWHVPSNFIDWDDRMYALYGVRPDQFSGVVQAWESCVHPEDLPATVALLQAALRGEAPYDAEFRVVWPGDGSVHWIKAYGSVKRSADGAPLRVVGVNWDVTARRQMEEALREAKNAAESATRAKSEFLANMSHEIRTPMNAVLGFAQLLLRDQHLDERQRGHLESILRSGDHLLGLINDLLEISRVEAGRLVLDEASFDLHALLAELETSFGMRASHKGLRLLLSNVEDVPRWVSGDEGKLRQIFNNLLSNAIKFTDLGGVAVRLRVEPAGAGSFFLGAEIEDSGHGIDQADLPRLFQKFEQTERGRRTAGGTGLGLVLSRTYAELMGGELSVESELGKGSVFRFRVRLAPGDDTAIPRSAVARRAKRLSPGQQRFKILVADDRADNREVLSQLLDQVGFEVRAVVDGAEAVREVEAWRPHLVLMDMRMPVMDGYEATRRIRALVGSDVVIVALSASAFEIDKAEARAAGADDFVSKPFREAVLCAKIGEWLGAEFEYWEASAAAAVPLDPAREMAVDTAALQDLPPHLRSELRAATISADIDRMLAILASVAERDAALAAVLKVMAEQYDYARLIALLDTAGGRKCHRSPRRGLPPT